MLGYGSSAFKYRLCDENDTLVMGCNVTLNERSLNQMKIVEISDSEVAEMDDRTIKTCKGNKD